MLELNNTTKDKINLKKTTDLVESFLGTYKKKNFSVSVALVGAARMRRLNDDYRGIDKATDVLSFEGNPVDKFLGEIIICPAEIKKLKNYAAIFAKPPKADYLFYFILVHGLLHLIGYDDETEKGRLEMVARGKEFLKKNGII
jgi:probable rRNA maturation factor